MTPAFYPALAESAASCRLEGLPWDTEFFGFPVAALRGEQATPTSVRATLRQAARQGVRLVYWEPEHVDLTAGDLSALGGVLACQRANFSRQPLTPIRMPDLQIQQVCQSDPALERLACAAGEWSRFRQDPSMPVGTCDRLYSRWLARSLQPSADRAVLAATDVQGACAGLVAVSLRGGQGVVQLLAVSAGHRRQGWGARLMAAAEAWAAAHGTDAMHVSTQLENQPACRLYADLGYGLEASHPVVHFWPQAEHTLRQADV